MMAFLVIMITIVFISSSRGVPPVASQAFPSIGLIHQYLSGQLVNRGSAFVSPLLSLESWFMVLGGLIKMVARRSEEHQFAATDLLSDGRGAICGSSFVDSRLSIVCLSAT
jgi:hypothetical protein